MSVIRRLVYMWSNTLPLYMRGLTRYERYELGGFRTVHRLVGIGSFLVSGTLLALFTIALIDDRFGRMLFLVPRRITWIFAGVAFASLPLMLWYAVRLDRLTRRLRSDLRSTGYKICPECGFDLRDCLGGRCPECGELFTPQSMREAWRWYRRTEAWRRSRARRRV